MEPLLLLVHRIPYPPNKGDKIRSYHLLEYLAERFDVHLAAFVDDPTDMQYQSILDSKCKSKCLIALDPKKAKLRSLKGLISNQALSVPYYYNRRLDQWVTDSIKQHNIKKFVVFSSSMAQYAYKHFNKDSSSILDFVDIDSDKWGQYAKSQRWPYSWIYHRESEKLLEFEKAMAKRFDLSLFVSRVEAELFQSMLNDETVSVSYYNNGVDYDHFDPAAQLPSPYSGSDPVIVFTGAMDYWANIDGVVWFASEILPNITAQLPKTRFYIVGGNPSADVVNLASDSVVVTGRVEDIRPYIQFADLAVAPLRIARGVQNKVLEAMSFNKPVVATEEAISGIERCPEFAPRIARDKGDFAKQCIDALLNPVTVNSRTCIKQHYDWKTNLSIVGEKLENRSCAAGE